MLDKNSESKVYGRVSRGSMDTSASANAESTISIGLSMFPDPPSSTPSTPLRSEFVPSPIRTTLPVQLNSSLPPAGRSHPSSSHSARRGHSFKINPTSYTRHAKDSVPGSSRTPSTNDLDGTSFADIDAIEERLLPTSFITALLQENKARRGLMHDAMSGISDMTYPPLLDSSNTDNTRYPCHSSGKPFGSHTPPSASTHIHKPFSRISGDSETLHSDQGYAPMIRTASVSRRVLVQGASVVGVGAAILHNVSGTKRISSSLNAGNPLSTDKFFYPSTHEGGDDPSDDPKTFDYFYSPSVGTQRALFHSEPVEPTSLLSRIPGLPLRRWKKEKPLPPVPDFSHTLPTMEHAHRRHEEAASLAELINRAGVLRDLLAKGQYPHHSIASYDVFSEVSLTSDSVQGTGEVKSEIVSMAAASHLPSSHMVQVLSTKHQPTATFTSTTRKKKRLYLLIFLVLIIVFVAVGAGVGVSVESRKKQHLPACLGNFTGVACNLDATCVCTSSVTCNGLAKVVVDLMPIVNQNFATNISLTSAYNSLWIMQGSPTTSNCASQALLADIGNANNEHLYPNRTQWAETALLWNAIQTQDMGAAGKLQQFVQKISWTSLGTTDGPVSTVADSDQRFSTTVAGFTFNFASETVTQPSASFVTLGQPTNAQISRVSSKAQTTLDRMYAFAQASSIQHQTALMTYWTTVLLQPPEDLAIFKAALSVSPVLLPFNASSPSIQTLYSNSTSSLFPPPLACFPNLTSEVQQKINSVETSVFGLQPANTTSKFDTSCYQDRPVYGVLDVLRLRLPFLDSQTGTVKEAVALTRDANPRVVLYNGLLFSTGPNVTSTITSSQLDPRQYGTLSLFDHVVLQYLTSMPDINTTSALVSFVLGTADASIPPDKSSPLFQSLQSIPFLEVAVFGDVGPPDLTSTVASFTTSSDSLFFGSPDGTDLRNWTINTVGGPVVWTENATSPLVVRDSSLGNTAISQTWDAISIAILNHIPSIGLANITMTLQNNQNFSP